MPISKPLKVVDRSHNKSQRAARNSVSRFVLKLIKDGRLYRQKGKGKAGEILALVHARFPGSKFSVSMYLWYRSRFRRQKYLGLPTSYLVKIPTRLVNMSHKRSARWPSSSLAMAS